jgi:hypothetical protein
MAVSVCLRLRFERQSFLLKAGYSLVKTSCWVRVLYREYMRVRV